LEVLKMAFRGGGNMSSSTNDPETAYMRVFVGNINTNNVTKPVLQRIFGRFGYVTAISIHRGFAFVQFDDYYCARTAATTMNGKLIGEQYADCNLAAEPKPNQKPPEGMEADAATANITLGKAGLSVAAMKLELTHIRNSINSLLETLDKAD
jgi:RNA recognition motif-containing protein